MGSMGSACIAVEKGNSRDPMDGRGWTAIVFWLLWYMDVYMQDCQSGQVSACSSIILLAKSEKVGGSGTFGQSGPCWQ